MAKKELGTVSGRPNAMWIACELWARPFFDDAMRLAIDDDDLTLRVGVSGVRLRPADRDVGQISDVEDMVCARPNDETRTAKSS